ncbi:ExeA family protein [Schlesneria sp. T3-172]|uniref:ExeA family protein n=1 Tax=Schlesneria sphaerica TaxID=3373610 RepID=UPI0037C5F940
MYEASFDLKRRPFGATPDATCFLAAAPIQAALDEVLVCIEQGQGISVVTAPAGVGKTLLCERLRMELKPRFETIFLRHASFLTRRALLQTLLCELNHSYQHSSEQELRLALWPAIRKLQPQREALVLICDEAHQLSKNLIEELRILADFAEAGKPLVRLVLVGQLNLEDKLALPSLEAFNQRIRAHVSLPTFDRAGSLDYIDYRLTWAGGRTHEIFTPQALDVIVQASDGVPRCMNQLADHTLLLAFVAEQRPAGEELVREALNDLRQLPLQWNEPSTPTRSYEQPTFGQTVESVEDDSIGNAIERNSSHPSAYAYESSSLEVGTELPAWKDSSFKTETDEPVNHNNLHSWETASWVEPVAIEAQSDDWKHVIDLFRVAESESSPSTSETNEEDAQEFTLSSASESSSTEQESSDEEVSTPQYTFSARSRRVDHAPQSVTSDGDDDETLSGELEESETESDETPSAPAPVTPRVDRQRSEERRVSSHSPANPQYISKPSEVFEEEVIFDRYAAIDAGFVPAFAPYVDTAKPAEVHAQPQTASSLAAQRDIKPVESETPMAPAQVIAPANAHELIVEQVLESVGPASHNLDSHELEQILGAVHELIELTNQEVAESHSSSSFESLTAPPIQLDEPQLTEEIVAEDVFDWNQSKEQPQRPQYVEHDPNLVEEAERTHDLYEEAAKTDWWSPPSRQDEEEILRSLQRDIPAVPPANAPSAAELTSTIESAAGWEVVETDPVEQTETKRPFRYLFSMLRRKQQQTH